jgi:hypothetical protein
MKHIYASIFLGLLLAARAAADPGAASSTAAGLNAAQDGCRSLAQLHLAAIERLGNYRFEGPNAESEFSLAVDHVEGSFLIKYDGQIRETLARLAEVEGEVSSLPPEQQSKVSLGSLTELCQLASTPVGASGIQRLRTSIQMNQTPVHRLQATDGLRGLPAAGAAPPNGAGKKEAPARPTATALSADEFRLKKERWEAQLKEQEARELAELRLRQQELDARQALTAQQAQAPAVAEPKVSVRKDLQPSMAVRLTAEQLALKDKVETWHQTYSVAVNPFKAALSQVLSTPATRARARREACGSLYGAAEALMKTKGLAAPDPAVAAPATAMAAKFQQAANSCMEGKTEESASGMREAELELGKLAAALGVYGLQP